MRSLGNGSPHYASNQLRNYLKHQQLSRLWYYVNDEEDKTEQMVKAICRAHKIHPWEAMISIMEAINACEEDEQCFIRIASALLNYNNPNAAYRCCLEGLSYYPDSVGIKFLLDSIDNKH